MLTMFRLMYLAAFIVALTVSARSAWLGSAGKDPMSGQKWASASATFRRSELPYIFFKCREGGNLRLGIVLGPYEASASFAPGVVAKFQIDKEEPFEILTVPTNDTGMLTLGVTSEDDPELIPLLKSILGSEHQVALSIGNSIRRSWRLQSNWCHDENLWARRTPC